MFRLQAPYTFPRIIDSNYGRQICWLWRAAIAEAQLNWSFIRRDMLVSLVPGTLFGTAALLNYPVHGLGDLILVLLKEVVYCWLCITTFCLSSQLVGIEEDRLNKPDRPLVVGRVTRPGARIRWMIGMIALTSFAAVTGTLLWALTWQIGCLLYDYCGGAKHWYGKTLLGGIGVTSEIGAAWQLVEPTIPLLVWQWLAVIGIYLTTLMAVQDFRDIAGDRAVGRRTMPIVFGEQFSRYVIAALCPDGASGIDAIGDDLGCFSGGICRDDRAADIDLSQSAIRPSDVCGVYGVVMRLFGLRDRGVAGLMG
jgi:4-hydroxybenzoate polyprenyltransferase